MMSNKSQQSMPHARVTTVVGPHPFLAELRASPVIANHIQLEFNDSYSPTHKAFRAMAEEQAFDICEMAMATYVQARAAAQPITLLPISLIGRFQHPQLVTDASRPRKAPKQLEGGRIGVRSYSQTTGVWVRSLLHSQFGVDLSTIDWIVVEESHVRGFEYPGNVSMAAPGSDLHKMLEEGQLDAVIGAYKGEHVAPLLENPGKRAKEWYDANRIVSVNHVLTARETLLDAEPDTVRDLYASFKRAVDERDRTTSATFEGPDWQWLVEVETLPTGYERLAPVLRFIADEVYEQGLIPAALPDNDLVNPLVREWK